MRIPLAVLSFFILVSELLGSLDLHEELSIRHTLEEVLDEHAPPSIKPQEPEKYDPKASSYAAPQSTLNDRMFKSVEEYPDGYTGYHCSIIGNFRYTMELCSKHVWECIDGKLFKKTCPGSLVFWFKEEVCAFPDFEPTCNYYEAHHRGPNWPMKFVHAARVKNKTYNPLMITTDCTKESSGFFALKECFPSFIYCSAGKLKLQPCFALTGENTVFDERIKNCVSMEACKAPLKDNEPGRSEIVLPLSDEQETIANRRFTPFLITTDCRNKKHIQYNYEIGKCHQNYLNCAYGERMIESCPIGEAFSLRKEGCIKMDECEETWDQWREPLHPFYPPGYRYTPVPLPQEHPFSFYRKPEEIVLVSTLEECVGKKNGNYAMSPCHAEYMNCSSNTGKILKCSEGFVFSRRFMECVGKEFCQE
ncbi:hypothetical protein CAEBREN_12858 [Caenorhabditis brenneri]|uniref:Chitin-binding type-2 domain-containing protein n=1 Tax=Caenorhabditis brenneri TaxID=135651 RepID=G0NXH2_CAEBE|nr:hypothetical protein CAEBREN_12858 [Caenorhabditis brenneri]